MIGRLVLLLVFSLYTICTSAQADGKRLYTKDNPLVYEDTWNLWPYSFLNEHGEPEGYNIDLLKLMMSKLDIPYVIKLKSRQEVLEDLKSGKCDLTVYMTTELYKGALYGKSPIMLFTQSVATPKNKPVTIKTFRDLNKKGQKVMVYENSLCHQLMLDYGMITNAIVKSDMSEVIKRVNDRGEGQIVWNTLSLKWLIYNYQLDNLVLSPVNMPHSECRYMANEQDLLDLLDNTYSNIYAGEELVPLEKKWFYPEKDMSNRIAWEWYVVWIASVLLVIIIIYMVRVLKKKQQITSINNELSSRLNQIGETNKVRIWTYNVKDGEFVWYDDKGKESDILTIEEFARRYGKKDFVKLKEAIDRLATQNKDPKGHEEKEMKLELKARDQEYGDGELHDFVVLLSVLNRDEEGHPSVIVGTKRDVTRERRLKRLNNERSLRYWSVFYNDEAGIVIFDKDGYILNANPKACELFLCDVDKSVDEHVHINQFLNSNFTNLREIDGLRGTQIVGKNKVEYQLKAAYNDKEELVNLYVFCL